MPSPRSGTTTSGSTASANPDHLAGDEIPLGGRIIHVADAFDSMRTNRVYQPARSSGEALHELRQLAGTQFCPLSVGALEQALVAADAREQVAAS